MKRVPAFDEDGHIDETYYDNAQDAMRAVAVTMAVAGNYY